MTPVLFAFIILAVLGFVLGIGLAIANKKLSVEKDERLVSLEEAMPGANCGGCGFAGCSAYAEAVFKGEAKVGLCSPGGAELARKMGAIMGTEVSEVPEKKVAFVFCKGNCDKTRKDFTYYGIEDCNAASLLHGGENSCKYGCLHLGSCISVCPTGAISKNENGEIVVDASLCIGCGRCADICPLKVIKLIPASARYVCACNSKDKGADTRKKCDVGCIGCKICEIKHPESGFKVSDNLSVHDYKTFTGDTDAAMNACPRKIILKVKG